MLPLHIVGAGGHAKVVVALAKAAGYQDIKLYDDGPVREVLGYEVVGGLAYFPDHPSTSAVLAIGANPLRHRLALRWQQVQWATLIHPAAWVDPEVQLGAGSVIMAGAVLQPGVRTGTHVIVNTAASVDHDCMLGDFVHIAPGTHLAGNVTLGTGVFSGVGSAYLPGNSVGAWSIIGAGAVVNKPVPDNVTAVGAPAKVIKERAAGWHLS